MKLQDIIKELSNIRFKYNKPLYAKSDIVYKDIGEVQTIKHEVGNLKLPTLRSYIISTHYEPIKITVKDKLLELCRKYIDEVSKMVTSKNIEECSFTCIVNGYKLEDCIIQNIDYDIEHNMVVPKIVLYFSYAVPLKDKTITIQKIEKPKSKRRRNYKNTGL